MAFKVDGDRPSPKELNPHWSRAVPLSGWVALIFYATAAFFGLYWISSLSIAPDMFALIMTLSCLATGTLLGALSRIIRILRDIRDHLGAG